MEPDPAPSPASSRAEIFNSHRARLFGIAYRMLGSRAEAEDVLQDAYLRWHGSDAAEIRTPEAWLVTVTTRLAIDRLRTLKSEREHYPGSWLPEPLVEAASSETPESVLEFSSDVSTAFLMVLERLGPEERAAFLLREVFDMDYVEVAQMLGKSEATCRQLVHRAKERVHQNRPRFEVSRAAHVRLLQRFVEASRGGDIKQLAALFAEDATLTGDGGGKVQSVTRVLRGTLRLARFFHVIARRFRGQLDYRLVEINGAPGLLRYFGGRLDSAFTIVTDGRKILDMYVVRNPDKLQNIAAPR
ncbi:MAG TPA: RNA polymerase sigma-70 factor [Burkholderiales bacterium]|jgi:RNA polymerase sigma-70 factor (ECF subfamily)|nr:RNA polymerase sigma-70 factor [Burkholderiales bacterium]